jgi:hypothetical protein
MARITPRGRVPLLTGYLKGYGDNDVEKLAHSEFAKIGSRQEALQTIFPSLLDIFYHSIFDFFQKNRLIQQPHPCYVISNP